MKIFCLLCICAVAFVNIVSGCSNQSLSPRRAPAYLSPYTADDIQPIIDALSPHIRVLQSPIYVWNWFNAKNLSSAWSGQLSATDGIGYEHFKSVASGFWLGFCAPDPTLNPPECKQGAPSFNPQDLYGPGLYVAIDPVSSASYGKGDGWVLMQLHLPAGTRLMDWNPDNWQDGPSSDEINNAILKMGCAPLINGFPRFVPNKARSILQSLAEPKALGETSSTCLAGVRSIFKEILQIDGLIYDFHSSQFPECSSASGHGRGSAMVLTDTSRLSADDVRVFNSQTIDDPEDRVRIQSLFYRASEQAPGIGNTDGAHSKTIAEASAPVTGVYTSGAKRNLLWRNLEGVALPVDDKTWLPKNLFDCSAP